VGNAAGILEYDGNKWRFIPVRTGAYVMSLAVDSSGTVFVGSQGEFGYLSPDKTGQLTYYSLSDSLVKAGVFFSAIWKTHVTRDVIVFQSQEKLFFYDYTQVKIVEPQTSFHTSFTIDNDFYIRQRGIGLMKYENGELSLIEDGALFSDIGVFAMLPFANSDPDPDSYRDYRDKILIATQENGLWVYHNTKEEAAIEKLVTKDNERLINAKIYGGITLHDNNFAFNTLLNGVIITDTAGRIINVINKNIGLRVNDVKQVFQDNQNNLWLTLSNGIGKVNYNSPLSYYNVESGLIGNVHAIVEFNNLLHVGTSNGLFLQNSLPIVNETDNASINQFNLIENLTAQIWNLTVDDNSLLIGTNEGLFELKAGKVKKIMDINAYAVYYSRKRNLLFVGGNQGLAVFTKDQSWKLLKWFDEVTVDIKGISVNPKAKSGIIEIWLGTSYQGVVRLIIDEKLNYKTDRYDSMDGINEDWILPFNFNNKVVFGTSTGLLSFVNEETVKNLLPDSLKNRHDLTRGYFERQQIFGTTYKKPILLLEDYHDIAWANIDNEVVYFDKENNDRLVSKPFLGIDYGKINAIYRADNGVCWFGADDGLIRYERNIPKNYAAKYHSIIRNVISAKDSILFSGSYFNDLKDKPFNLTSSYQPDKLKPDLSYSLNSISFEYSAPFYEDEEKLLFAYKLVGYDDMWSNWIGLTKTGYTNLYEGEYKFIVKAKNIYQHESVESTYEFTILPPWYRTWWAYLLYLLGAATVFYGAIKINSRRLEREKEVLEGIVAERTAVVVSQKKELTDSINYAQNIQQAMLPSNDEIKELLPNSFVLFKPKDIVSGDFYWATERDGAVFYSAADCTGHGVPGAFMSMICSSLLSEAVNGKGITNPAKVFFDVRKGIITHFKQTEKGQKDGMDAILCALSKPKGESEDWTLECVCANNPLFILRKSNGKPLSVSSEINGNSNDEEKEPVLSENGLSLFEIKPDKQPVGFLTGEQNPFTNHVVKLLPGDIIYSISDGFQDQFGGPKGKKFMIKQLKKLFLEIGAKDLKEQKQHLDTALEDWMAHPEQPDGEAEQVDDILVIGVRI